MRNILLIAFIFISFSVFAVNVNGVVYNVNDKTPLNECTVLLMQNGKVMKLASTNNEGYFFIEVNEQQNYTLEFLKSGYKLAEKEIMTNQDFLTNQNNIEVYLTPGSSTSLNIKNELVKEPNPNLLENIGDISSLPKGTKLIEVKPLKHAEKEATGFNVQKKNIENQPTVNVNEFKATFNKESLKANVYNNIEKTPSSYYKEGSVFYESGKALLSNEVKVVLSGIAQKLNSDLSLVLNIKAFADSEREFEVGTEISKLRVEELIKYLMEQNVSFSKLKVTIIGNSILENECYKGASCTEVQHQANRRVELIFEN